MTNLPDAHTHPAPAAPGTEPQVTVAEAQRLYDENGEPVSIEGNGFFARMLQHEVGHLDGFLYVDVLIGRNARAAKRAIKANGWGVPGLSWVPGTVPDPFGHDDE